ncbi:MAG: DUF58 domain-containing protein [Actinomycetota bacterium]
MRATASPKLITYLSVTASMLFLALLLGRVELLVLVAPFVTALAVGLAFASTPEIEVDVEIDADRCLERELVHVAVEIRSTVRVEADVALGVPAGFTAQDATTTTVVGPDAPRRPTFTLTATRWGAHLLGLVALRLHAPGRLLDYEEVVDLRRLVKVYPAAERMRKEIEPPQTQVFSGNYVSRASGDGIEFSGVRPFESGDSRRRVNWRVTSRRGQLHVNEFHPERNADVILFLDTFADAGPADNTSLDLAIRGAATLARHSLMRKDRVGLVAYGGLLGWLTANSGQPHLYRIVDYLIGVEATLSYARKDVRYLPPRALPQMALIIAFSPLVDERALEAIVDLHGRGYSLIVVDTLAEDAVAPGPTAEDQVAHRAWKLLRAAQRFELTELGVPVVAWSGEAGLESVAALLPPLQRMPRARHA